MIGQKEKDQLIQSLQSKIKGLEAKLEDYSQGGIKILFSGIKSMPKEYSAIYEKLLD